MTNIRHLKNIDEVLEALGGDEEVARITRHKTGAIKMWRYGLKTLPAKTYVILKHALKQRGCEAPDELWGSMIPLKERA